VTFGIPAGVREAARIHAAKKGVPVEFVKAKKSKKALEMDLSERYDPGSHPGGAYNCMVKLVAAYYREHVDKVNKSKAEEAGATLGAKKKTLIKIEEDKTKEQENIGQEKARKLVMLEKQDEELYAELMKEGLGVDRRAMIEAEREMLRVGKDKARDVAKTDMAVSEGLYQDCVMERQQAERERNLRKRKNSLHESEMDRRRMEQRQRSTEAQQEVLSQILRKTCVREDFLQIVPGNGNPIVNGAGEDGEGAVRGDRVSVGVAKEAVGAAEGTVGDVTATGDIDIYNEGEGPWKNEMLRKNVARNLRQNRGHFEERIGEDAVDQLLSELARDGEYLGAEFGAVLENMLAANKIKYNICVFVREDGKLDGDLVPHKFYVNNGGDRAGYRRLDVLLEHEGKIEAHYSLLVLSGDEAVPRQLFMVGANMRVSVLSKTQIEVRIHPTRGRHL
jgi:DNA-binding XRE family transcriptional regulator